MFCTVSLFHALVSVHFFLVLCKTLGMGVHNSNTASALQNQKTEHVVEFPQALWYDRKDIRSAIVDCLLNLLNK